MVELRRDGERLSADVLALVRPLRGLLSLYPARPGWQDPRRNAPLLAGLLAAGQTSWLVHPLSDARVVRIEHRGMLIVGVQRVERMRRLVDYRQAWWIRPVS